MIAIHYNIQHQSGAALQIIKRPKLNNKNVLKKLQTELQALIAYGCYDSKQVLKSGNSAKKNDIINNLCNLYMTKLNSSDHLSQVEAFLEGQGKYSYLFEEISNEGDR